MSKKIDFGTIKENELGIMSNYNVTCKKMIALAKKYKTDRKVIEKEIDTILEERKKAMDEGKSFDEAMKEYSISEKTVKLNALEIQYKKDREPLQKAIDVALEIIPDDSFEAYKEAMKKGELASLTKKVDGFLSGLGIITPEKATSKFAQIMSVRISGMRRAGAKDRDNGHFVSCKSEKEFKELFMCAFLEYVVVDKGVVDVNEDGTLSMHVFA